MRGEVRRDFIEKEISCVIDCRSPRLRVITILSYRANSVVFSSFHAIKDTNSIIVSVRHRAACTISITEWFAWCVDDANRPSHSNEFAGFNQYSCHVQTLIRRGALGDAATDKEVAPQLPRVFILDRCLGGETKPSRAAFAARPDPTSRFLRRISS